MYFFSFKICLKTILMKQVQVLDGNVFALKFNKSIHLFYRVSYKWIKSLYIFSVCLKKLQSSNGKYLLDLKKFTSSRLIAKKYKFLINLLIFLSEILILRIKNINTSIFGIFFIRQELRHKAISFSVDSLLNNGEFP